MKYSNTRHPSGVSYTGYVMRRYLVGLLALYSFSIFASEEYCIDKVPAYKEKLNSIEICRYSKSCLVTPQSKKIFMYCDNLNLSECFEEKSWLGIHDYLDVHRSTVITGASKRYKSENGELKKIFFGVNTKKS